ncbi:hypothetical protein [Psychroflexus torquis]|uniref:hypothetical protein n=1 Tax=Psychroflexus torquis TaxID=57029 RepID=UPI0003186137|nr:hypothetical protein [Psychroflexus torquis]
MKFLKTWNIIGYTISFWRSGSHDFFISNREDYLEDVDEIEDEKEVKIIKHICCR